MPHRANGSYVSNSDALTAWTPIAHEKLLETARTYHAVITHDELAAAVQAESGIIHDQPPAVWVGKLLDRASAEAARRGEPPLAALCLGDSDDHLRAERRLLCYRAYADDLPADGGVPDVHRRFAPSRVPRQRAAATPRTRASATRAPATPTLREVTCPSCWMIVPDRPTCFSCGASLAG
jgi:hypothetical protein